MRLHREHNLLQMTLSGVSLWYSYFYKVGDYGYCEFRERLGCVDLGWMSFGWYLFWMYVLLFMGYLGKIFIIDIVNLGNVCFFRGYYLVIIVDFMFWGFVNLIKERIGVDLLFQALRPSTIGAMRFHYRVRDGIGCLPHAIETNPLFNQIHNKVYIVNQGNAFKCTH